MNGPADGRLQRLLGGEHLAGLRKRLRRRLTQAAPERPRQQIRIDGLTTEEHAALASLTGQAPRFSASMRIDLGLVDASFRDAGIAASLRDALEQIDGPLVDAAAMRRRLRDQWAQVVGNCSDSALLQLLGDPAGLGLLKRLARQDPARATELRRCAEGVLQRLPARGVTRSQLAAEVLGDAHALDMGHPVATLVLAARRRLAMSVRAEANAAAEQEADADPQRAAESARQLWAAAGVLVNELARPVLFLNLPMKGVAPAGGGDPCYASLRSLLRTPPPWDVSGRDIHVCENPNLIAIAADRLGSYCAPLVCTDGMPAAAQRTLLSQLVAAGGRLHYHGDFDWPGVRITNHVIREHSAEPWRFGVDDYLAALRNAPDVAPSLDGTVVAASWDDALTAAMARHRVAIAEEAVADGLLHDLDCTR